MSTTDDPHADAKGLRSRLRELRSEKDSLFSQRNAVSQKIRTLIGQIKAKKGERNQLTDAVKAQKEERSKLSGEIREKIEKIKQLKEKAGISSAPRPAQGSKGGFRESPSKIRARIEDLNRRVETEGLTFDKEQQVMKQIKDLKRQLDEAKASDAGSDEIRSMSKEIDALKAKADASHEDIQVKAKQSQSLHEQILVLSKEVDALKVQETSLQEAFLAKKAESDKLASQLGEAKEEEGRREFKRQEQHDRQAKAEEARQKKRLSDRIVEVHDKMKRGEKLTTEDLITLQGEDSDE